MFGEYKYRLNLLSKVSKNFKAPKTKHFFPGCRLHTVNPGHSVVSQNVDNDVPVVHSLSDGKIAEMVLDNNKYEDSSDEDDDIVNTSEKMPIDDLVKLYDQLIGGLEQRTFISVHVIMAVYSIKETLLRQKPLLMKQMTLEEIFQKAVS